MSSASWQYWPAGSQNGHILAGSFAGIEIGGPSHYPESNSYSRALSQCANQCDANLSCLSFNVFTVVEDDFNDCVPTFRCRFSNELYNPMNYIVDIRAPSYAWTLEKPDPPNCHPYSRERASPVLWQNRGLDQFLRNLTRTAGLWDQTSDFALDLMDNLNVSSYPCLDLDTSCNIPSLDDHCSTWVDRSIATYERYMKHNSDILDKILTQISVTGYSIFNSFWRDASPDQSSFDSRSLIEGIVDGALGCIPEIGAYAYLVAVAIQDVVDSIWPDKPPIQPVIPNEASAWVSRSSSSYPTLEMILTRPLSSDSRTNAVNCV